MRSRSGHAAVHSTHNETNEDWYVWDVDQVKQDDARALLARLLMSRPVPVYVFCSSTAHAHDC